MNQQFDPNNPVFQQLGGFQNFQNAFNALSQQVPQNFGPKTVGQQFVQQRMDGRPMDGRSMMGRDNYSGHSVKDRMIDTLERMRDSAQSQAEMRDIEAEIQRIRNEK